MSAKFILDLLQSPPGVLGAAAFLDFILGDPWGWPHPVRVMGWLIQLYQRWICRLLKTPWQLKVAGAGLAIGLVLGSGLVAWAIVQVAYKWSPWGWSIEVILLASCFAGRSLRAAAEAVLRPLKAGSLSKARSVLSLYVGRETQNLTEREILRAVLETVAENATDGVMAPLFYAMLGLVFPQIGPVPFAIAYKAASTLDSMVGYREEPFTHLGWCSAKLDDLLTWVPCRLNVLTLGAISGELRSIWTLCERDAHQDPSPNSGWSECAYAAILSVQLGGLNTYRGVLKLKPLLGDARRPITAERIQLALRLMRNSFIAWLAVTVALWILTLET